MNQNKRILLQFRNLIVDFGGAMHWYEMILVHTLDSGSDWLTLALIIVNFYLFFIQPAPVGDLFKPRLIFDPINGPIGAIINNQDYELEISMR